MRNEEVKGKLVVSRMRNPVTVLTSSTGQLLKSVETYRPKLKAKTTAKGIRSSPKYDATDILNRRLITEKEADKSLLLVSTDIE